jgi:putative ABC transport system substrate-binding protein
MRRREFITLLSGAAAWPLTIRAQQLNKLPTIGFLGSTSHSAAAPWVTAFQRRLWELGWDEGRNVTIEYRWGEGRGDRFAEIAAEFVKLKVDVIVTAGGAVSAVKRETALIPIVFAVASDPVGGGLVDSLAHPGGNVTGLSLQFADTSSKRLELLREILPRVRRLAVLANASYRASVLEMKEVQTLARGLSLEAIPLEVRRMEDIAPSLEAIKNRADAVYVAADPLLTSNRNHIGTLALQAKLPTVTGAREYTEAGGLLSYGASYSDLYRRAADFVDKILHGEKPSNIPVEQPTKFELVINLNTAKALGLHIPEAFLLRVDEVIE